MKILVATHSYGLNGASAILKSMLAHWASAKGWKIDVLMTDNQFQLHAADIRDLGTNPIQKANTGVDYHFVLINTAVNLKYIDLFFKKIPIILWVHEGTTLVQNLKSTPADIIKSLSKPDLLIFQTPWQSDSVFRSFIHHLPASRITSIPCGIEINGRIPARSAALSNKARIISIGSVYPRKRQLDLAMAVIQLSSRRAIECSFLGSLKDAGAYGPQARHFFEAPPESLHWLGGVSEDEKLQKIVDADMACFPSGDETFGISALETALLGKPVILADLPVYREVGWIDGKNCLMFPVGDVGALERQLEKLLDDPVLQRTLSAAGKTLALRYDMDAFFSKMTTACLGALGSRPQAMPTGT